MLGVLRVLKTKLRFQTVFRAFYWYLSVKTTYSAKRYRQHLRFMSDSNVSEE